MKYNTFTLGQIEAVFNMLGGESGVKRFLSSETVVVPSKRDSVLQQRYVGEDVDVFSVKKLDEKLIDIFGSISSDSKEVFSSARVGLEKIVSMVKKDLLDYDCSYFFIEEDSFHGDTLLIKKIHVSYDGFFTESIGISISRNSDSQKVEEHIDFCLEDKKAFVVFGK